MQKTPKPKPKAISENQKWKEAGEVFQVAQSILSKCGMEQYKARLACVQKLISLWQEDKEAFVGEFVVTDISDETPDESRTDENESRNSTFGLPNLPEPHEDLPDLMELENKSIEPEEQPAPAQPDTQPTSVESEEQPATVQPDDQPTSPDLQGVRFAPVPRKRGRPKGACTTAIGLPLKRIKKANNSKTPYHRKSSAEKGRMLLSFFVDVSTRTEGVLLGEESVECVPENIPSSALDENVDINMIRKFFDADGWLAVSGVYEARKQLPWKCQQCNTNLEDSDPSIGCDSCLNWNHWRCVGLKTKPKRKFWFCKDCC